jgi:hypothetical protein
LIAAYNAAVTLPRAFASLRAQSHSDWDLVVVEDGSHDGTEALVRIFAATESRPVHYENLGVNRGVSGARNRLLELATGDAVAFLDADDWWEENHLAHGLVHLRAGAGLVITGVRTFDLETDLTLGLVLPPPALETRPVHALFFESAIVTCSCVLLARKTVAQTGVFDLNLSVGEDRDYWLRAALAQVRFQIEPLCSCHYAKHRGSTMAHTLKVTDQTVRFYEKHFDLPSVPITSRRRQLAHALLNAGRLHRAGSARTSIRELWRAWRLTPNNALIALHLAFSGARLWRRPA